MIIDYREYQIEILDDNNYSQNSTDNINHYDLIYSWSKSREEFSASCAHSINIYRNNTKIKNAILLGFKGDTSIHNNSYIIKDNSILICCSNNIYSLHIPTLSCNWKNSFDIITCFAIHEFKNNFIIHGELEISCIDINGNKQWSFYSNDIFVRPDGKEAIKIKKDSIEITDWNLKSFTLDENGNLLNETKTPNTKQTTAKPKNNNILTNLKRLFNS